MNNYPDNPNFLSELNYRFYITNMPEISFFVQSVTLPAVQGNQASYDTPFVRVPVVGDHLYYNPFRITFKVDENLRNYLALYDWMTSYGFPDSWEQRKRMPPEKYVPNSGVYSDGVIQILNSSLNVAAEFQIVDMFPTSITGLQLGSIGTTVDYVDCSAVFAYRTFHYTIFN